jgi:hypothetical protein
MAENEDLTKRIEELEKQLSSKSNAEQMNKIAEATRRAAMSADDLNAAINAGSKKYEEIDKNIKTIAKNKKTIIDYEQIENDLKEERLNRLKEEFRLNQQTLVQLLEEREVVGENNDELNKKIKHLEETTRLQGKAIQDANKEKEIKEKILVIAKETLQLTRQYGSELEKHIIQISTLNGGYDKYKETIGEANKLLYASTVGTGIMFEEANRSIQQLSTNFIGLSTQSAESINQMSLGVSRLGKLGVDAATASRGFDSLVNAMGKTPAQAYKIQESFVQMASKNRLALGSVAQAFAENSSRFVGYGEQMSKVLDGLAEQSLKTGIAIGKLVGIAQGFDTFEDASRKVGNLNALLGGDYFNSIELLTASDDERIRLIKEGVAASGMQFESMNRFEQMAIANAAGINDLNEASKLFGQTSLQNTRQQAEGAEVQKTLAEQAQSATLAMDKLKSSLNGLLIILEPIVTTFMKVVNVIADGVQELNNFFSSFETLGKTGGAIFTSIIMASVFALGKLIFSTRMFGGVLSWLGSGLTAGITKMKNWIFQKSLFDKANSTKPNFEGITKFKTGPAASSVASAAPTPAGSGKFTSFINNIKPGNLIVAAGALLILSAALFITAKALQEFSTGVNWDGVGKAGVALASLVVSALILSKFAGQIGIGALVVLALSASLLVLGFALQMFSKVDWKLVAGVGAIILGLGLAIAGLGLMFSGPQAITLTIGIGIIIAIGAALAIMGIALKNIVDAIANASPALSNLANSFKQLFEIKDLKDNFSSIESFLAQLSNVDYEPINTLANAIGLLATNLERLASFSANMNIRGNVESTVTENISKTVQEVAATASEIGQTSNTQQTLIPAQQTTAFVPLVVQIDKKTIIEILKEDIANISKGQALDAMDAIGLAQSGLFSMDRISVGNDK